MASWLTLARDTIANIARIEPALQGVPCNHIFGLVVYDLPGRDCAAKASNGELPVGAINRYKTEYIDSIYLPFSILPSTLLTLDKQNLPLLSRNIQTRPLLLLLSLTRFRTWSPMPTLLLASSLLPDTVRVLPML